MLEDLKIKLQNHAQFLEAQDAFMKLGYHWGGGVVPCTAPYLYTYEDGRILADYFDVEGADLSSPNSAFGYFTNSEKQEVTLDQLKIMAYGNDVQMTSEQQIEQEIQDKGLNAPRVTPEHIDSLIVSEIYITGRDAINAAMNSATGLIKSQYAEGVDLLAPAETLTFCILILKNGFTVTGVEACVSIENFDAEIGRKYARENARNKIWQLEGYLLKERLYQGTDSIAIGMVTDPKPPIQIQGLDGELPVPTADMYPVIPDWRTLDGDSPILGNEQSDPKPNLQSCSGSVSYGNTNHRTIELLLEILRTTTVGSDVSDKARAKLSELVDKI